jgi:hypothetical protein
MLIYDALVGATNAFCSTQCGAKLRSDRSNASPSAYGLLTRVPMTHSATIPRCCASSTTAAPELHAQRSDRD